jgi:hypothetical protein
MEYIVGQFENMTSYLAAPDAQTKESTEDLFSGAESPRAKSPQLAARTIQVDEGYMAEVQKYIEGVQTYTADLKRRFDEAKALNGIQLAIIDDLRKEMSAVQQNLETSLDQSPPRRRRASSPGRKEVDSSWESIETAVEEPEEEIDIKPSRIKPTLVDSGTQTKDCRKVIVVRKSAQPTQRGFWTSLYEALDGFGDDLHER